MGVHGEIDGFDSLFEQLEKYAGNADNYLDAVESGAEKLVQDIRSLPRPRSQCSHTHLLDTVSHKIENNEIVVGWGKYYGPMLEHGTKKMRKQMHIRPTFENNREKYYRIIQQKLFE